MSEEARRLRRADERQLRSLAVALQKGRFGIVVADAATWPLASAALGIAPSGEFTLQSGDDVVKTFDAPEAAGEGVVLLHMREDAGEAMAALNLNRDKLRGRNCRFLLRLDGLPAFQRFVREAPDCYSIRDAVALVEPWQAIALEPDAEPESDLEDRITRTGSPEKLYSLGRELLRKNRPKEAHRALDRGIALLDRKRWLSPLSPRERWMLATLHHQRVQLANRQERRLHVQAALYVLEPVREQFSAQYAAILGELSDAYGIEIPAAREALEAAHREVPQNPDHTTRQLSFLANAYCARGDIRKARDALARVRKVFDPHIRLFLRLNDALILIEEGGWKEATYELQDELRASTPVSDRSYVARFARELSRLFIRQGELEAAVEVIASLKDERADARRRAVRCSHAEIGALRALEDLAESTVNDGDFSDALVDARDRAGWVRRGVRAGLLEEESRERMNAAIAVLAAQVAASAPENPPWAQIDVELLIADNLLARPGKEQQATEAAERALAFARAGAPELIAQCVRRLAAAALRSGATAEIDALLEEATRSTETHHLPGEAARIAGLRLWLAIQRGAAVEEAEKALEAAFERSGSVLVQAEVLLRIGRGAGRRDLIARARRIYHGLPWPEREGACLEALGMPEAARNLYESFGLKLAALAVARSPEPEPVDA